MSNGVHRPHAPYRAGEGFAAEDLYPHVTGPLFPLPPDGSPYMAGNWQGEDITNVDGVGSPSITVDPAVAIEIRRYYFAALTWSDYMLGKALNKLEELGVANKTITIFHSDHGSVLPPQRTVAQIDTISVLISDFRRELNHQIPAGELLSCLCIPHSLIVFVVPARASSTSGVRRQTRNWRPACRC